MSLKIEPIHIKYKKQIGHVGSNPVHEILTTGGLYMNILGKGAGFEVIGTGPHRAIARHISENKQPNIVWDGLSKSDHVDLEDYMYLLPKYVAITDALRARQKERDNE
jgi:hypothetical protein